MLHVIKPFIVMSALYPALSLQNLVAFFTWTLKISKVCLDFLEFSSKNASKTDGSLRVLPNLAVTSVRSEKGSVILPTLNFLPFFFPVVAKWFLAN